MRLPPDSTASLEKCLLLSDESDTCALKHCLKQCGDAPVLSHRIARHTQAVAKQRPTVAAHNQKECRRSSGGSGGGPDTESSVAASASHSSGTTMPSLDSMIWCACLGLLEAVAMTAWIAVTSMYYALSASAPRIYVLVESRRYTSNAALSIKRCRSMSNGTSNICLS